LATRSAVRWRVPDSRVSIEESGTSCGAGDLADLAVGDDRAVHLGQLAQAGGGEADVENEAAGADLVHRLVVAEDDQRAGPPAEDALQAVPQFRARRDRRQRGAQQLLGGALLCHETPRRCVVEWSSA
jgi:hypothetical protein